MSDVNLVSHENNRLWRRLGVELRAPHEVADVQFMSCVAWVVGLQ